MSPKAERRVNLPLRGRCRRQKGCISSAPQARLYGFRCLWQRLPPQAAYILIARRAIPPPFEPEAAQQLPLKIAAPAATTTLSANGAVKPKNLPAHRPVNPKNPSIQPFYTTRRRQAATILGAKGPVHLPLRTLGPLGPSTLTPQSGPFTAEPSCDTMKPTDGDGVRRAISCFCRMLLRDDDSCSFLEQEIFLWRL